MEHGTVEDWPAQEGLCQLLHASWPMEPIAGVLPLFSKPPGLSKVDS